MTANGEFCLGLLLLRCFSWVKLFINYFESNCFVNLEEFYDNVHHFKLIAQLCLQSCERTTSKNQNKSLWSANFWGLTFEECWSRIIIWAKQSEAGGGWGWRKLWSQGFQRLSMLRVTLSGGSWMRGFTPAPGDPSSCRVYLQFCSKHSCLWFVRELKDIGELVQLCLIRTGTSARRLGVSNFLFWKVWKNQWIKMSVVHCW